MPVVKPTYRLPVVFGSLNEWGEILNTAIKQIDGFQSDLVSNITGIEIELGRLEQEKLSLKDADKLIEVKVNNYIEIHTKPDLDNYIEGLKANNIKPFVEAQKVELNDHNEVKKTELDSHSKAKESEITVHSTTEKEGITAHANGEKLSITDLTDVKKVEVTTHTDNEIKRVTAHTTGVEIPRLTAQADLEIERIRAVGVDGILDEIDFTTGDTFHFDRDENSDAPIGDFRRGKTYKLGELVDKIYDEKQFKTDSDLQTISKSVVGAINEVNDNKLDKTAKAVDSDKLDGQDSTYFAKQTDMTNANTQINQNKSDILLKANISDIPNLIGDISKTPNGWCKLVNGLIVQWGYHGQANTSNIVLPISFSTEYSIALSTYGTRLIYHAVMLTNKTNTGFTYTKLNVRDTESNAHESYVSWIAIGY